MTFHGGKKHHGIQPNFLMYLLIDIKHFNDYNVVRLNVESKTVSCMAMNMFTRPIERSPAHCPTMLDNNVFLIFYHTWNDEKHGRCYMHL